jgi:glycosyltransferase involved in cell wall biosynthesis
MRIALMSWESLYSIQVGGVAAHVSELARGLHARGHTVDLFTRLDAGQARYECIEGVHYHRCPFDPNVGFGTYVDRMCDSFVARLAEAEAFYGQPFDVVHAHDWMCVRALTRAKNDLGRRAVLTLHSTEFGRCGNTLPNGRSEQVRSIEWEGAYVADRLICVSGALLDEVRWLYSVPAQKASVIYNGVDVHRFDGSMRTRTSDASAVRWTSGIATRSFSSSGEWPGRRARTCSWRACPAWSTSTRGRSSYSRATVTCAADWRTESGAWA